MIVIRLSMGLVGAPLLCNTLCENENLTFGEFKSMTFMGFNTQIIEHVTEQIF